MPVYSIRGINVEFPFEAYPCQITYMDRVIQSLQNKCHALLESPTGTGKTLCLLCATIAWRNSLGSFSTRGSAEQGGGFPTIVYASRTHSQLRQVIKELKRCIYRPKMLVLGSREQLCVNEEVNSLRGKALINACQYLCQKRGNRQCNHFNRVPDYLKNNPDIGDEPVDIEDLVNIGKDSGPCPYYITREVHKDADILFAPYNYLISNAYSKYLKVDWSNSVLIFDEAHNLESLCSDSASFDLPSVLLSACISEAQECVELASARRVSLNDESTNPENFSILKGLLRKLQELISEVPIPKKDEGFTKPGPYIYEMLESLNITHETAPKLIGTVEEAAVLLDEEKQRTVTNAGSKLGIIADMFKLIFRENGSNYADVYRVHVQELEQNSTDVIKGNVSRTLSWWCFNPGITMQAIAKKGVGSIILTSGTLSSMDSLAQELKLEFPVRLKNPHVISSNQLWAGVVSTGPSGRDLNSCYSNRDVPEYKQELGNVIVEFSRVVPDGLLVFFPSYFLMDRCITFWKDGNSMTIWERICELKKPVIEPKDSSLFPAAMQDFSEKLQDRSISGAVFFAVCRGKVSEGLDFADSAGRAVVITGLPYARVTDPKVKLKREFLDEQSQLAHVKFPRSTLLSGSMWYGQEAAQAVNQAIGRVIRHRHDYGAIIFCDERFVRPSQRSKISVWIQPYVKCYSRFGEVISDLDRFFRTERSNIPARIVTEQENNIGNSYVKDVGVVRNELSRLEAFPPGPSESGGNNVKWKGVTILQRKGKMPRIVKGEARSSRKNRLVELSDEKTQVEKRCEVVDLDCEKETFTSSNRMGLIKKRKVPESQGSASLSKEEGGDNKQASASAFLGQVKEKLNGEEYNKFVGYVQGLKKKELKLANVMPSIVQLLCGTERDHLLMGFKDFVPVKYRLAYEQCIKMRKREA